MGSEPFPDAVDILIAGAGPAGLAAAAAGAKLGCSVLVVEREAEIGYPVHTSGGTTLGAMQRFGIPGTLYHPIDRLRLVGPSRSAVYELRGVLVIIDVTGVYRHLAKIAQDSGAEVRLSSPARAVLQDQSMVVGCTVADRTIRSRVLIDATGYRAALSRQAALHPGFQRFGVGAEYELIAPHCRPDEAVLIVGSRYAPAGYAWVFPWGEGRVRVGVGVLHRDTRADPLKHLELLLVEAAALGIDLSQAERRELHTGLIPSEGLAGSFVTDGMMAVGDAAGQASLVVGEGIRLSLLAGQRAGTVAAEAIRKGVVTRDALQPYESWFRTRYERTLEVGYAINQRLARYDDAAWDERIAIARQIPPELMMEVLQSNFPLSQVVRWLLAHPRQWPRVFRFASSMARRRPTPP